MPKGVKSKEWCKVTFRYVKSNDNTKAVELPKKKNPIEEAIQKAIHSLSKENKSKKITMNNLYKEMWFEGYTREEVDTYWGKNKKEACLKYTHDENLLIIEMNKGETTDKLKMTINSEWIIDHPEKEKEVRPERKKGVEGQRETRARQALSRTWNDKKSTPEQRKRAKELWERFGFFGKIGGKE